jgi:hypothetical protein
VVLSFLYAGRPEPRKVRGHVSPMSRTGSAFARPAVTAVARGAEQPVDATGRANISRVTRLLRCVLAAVGVTAAVVLFGVPAFAAPSQVTFEPAKVPVVFSATGTGGGPFTVQADVLESTLLLGETPPYLPAPPPGESYLEIEFQTAESQVPFVPLALPLSAATLVTADATVSPAGVDLPPDSFCGDAAAPSTEPIAKVG